MKKLIYLLGGICVSALVCCDMLSGVAGGTQMDTEEATAKVVETLKNIDPNEWKIYKVEWFEQEELSNELGTMNVWMVNKNNSAFFQTFVLYTGSVGDLREASGMGPAMPRSKR